MAPDAQRFRFDVDMDTETLVNYILDDARQARKWSQSQFASVVYDGSKVDDVCTTLRAHGVKLLQTEETMGKALRCVFALTK